MVAGLGFKADVPAVGNIEIRTQHGTDKCIFQFGVAALCEKGQPCLLRFAAGSIVSVKLKTVRQRRDDQIGIRCFAGEHTRFHGYAAVFSDGLQMG